ncbi:MAG: ATP-binding protein [Bacilli bacterium]|jgi:hypothetical protein|nr:ATP-binding protein [Bacilli bacterium]
MLEKIILINDNEAHIKINTNQSTMADLVNLHLIFEDEERKILGEITQINNDIIIVHFLGEFQNNIFIPGIIKKPKLSSQVRVIDLSELEIIMNNNDESAFNFGKSIIYNNMIVNVNIDALFSNHLAIFGNTGSGKSYGVSKILQSLFYNPNNIAFNSTFFLFDVHGEYDTAFKDMHQKNPNYYYKAYTTNPKQPYEQQIFIPIWLLDIEDIAFLLGATDFSQLAIIEKAMITLAIITQNDEIAAKYKNHLIAKSIQNVLYSNLSTSKIRSEIFEIISICSTPEFDFDTDIPGIGYTRKFKKCFNIGRNGQFSENVLINEYLEKFIDDDLERQEVKAIGKCNLYDLENALNFVIISENILIDDKFYNLTMMLKMKLKSLIAKGYAKLFDYPEYINKEQFIVNLITNEEKRKAQVINIDIEGLNINLASFITRTYAKIIFSFISLLKNRASIPIHLLLEEAHHFIHNKDSLVYGENIFERIAKEGRKYGVVLTLISQRPTELSETVLSQCASFLLFRTNHPKDLEYMKKAIPNINTDIIDRQRSIQPGYCVGFGKAFKIPLIIKLDEPDPPPHSSSARIFNIWSGRNLQ